jgi:putative nucleotidyltransferase with HDIG domain
MRVIKTNLLKGNEVLGKTIYGFDGRVILRQGVKLSPIFVRKLIELGFSSIYIEDKLSDGVEPEEMLSNDTVQKTIENVKGLVEQYSRKGHSTFDGVVKSSNLIIDNVMQNRGVLISLSEIRSKYSLLYTHAINTCSLATVMAIRLGYNVEKVKAISIGALLHDIGKIQILKDLNLDVGKMDQIGLDLLKTHTKLGYEILGKDYSINALSKIIVLMHHEYVDGSGYPLSLKNNDINPAARLVSICNDFDNLISGRTEYGPLSVVEAVQVIKECPHLYDESIVEVFIENIAIFPTGTTVQLSNGLKAIVVSQTKGNPYLPNIRIVTNEQGEILDMPYEIKLTENRNITIEGPTSIEIEDVEEVDDNVEEVDDNVEEVDDNVEEVDDNIENVDG